MAKPSVVLWSANPRTSRRAKVVAPVAEDCPIARPSEEVVQPEADCGAERDLPLRDWHPFAPAARPSWEVTYVTTGAECSSAREPSRSRRNLAGESPPRADSRALPTGSTACDRTSYIRNRMTPPADVVRAACPAPRKPPQPCQPANPGRSFRPRRGQKNGLWEGHRVLSRRRASGR